jgi:hypothetical protein
MTVEKFKFSLHSERITEPLHGALLNVLYLAEFIIVLILFLPKIVPYVR